MSATKNTYEGIRFNSATQTYTAYFRDESEVFSDLEGAVEWRREKRRVARRYNGGGRTQR